MALPAEPAAPDGDPLLPRVARVLRRTRELPDTVTLELATADGSPFPAYRPGEFTMLYVFGVGEIPVSISGDPADRMRLVQTIRAVGPVSSALSRLSAGDVLGIRGPYGTAWPVAAAEGRDVLLMAGGLGLAPLRPAIYQLLANRQKFGRLELMYGTRSPDEILFLHQIENWRRRLDFDVEVTVDHAGGTWRRNVGVVTRLIPRMSVNPRDAIAMVCGPEVMMRYGAIALHDAGMPESGIWMALERNMKCAVGLCGHCQFAGSFACKDGSVMRYDTVRDMLALREI
ncbi:MAG: FAD/NAD(P)-binding protein [Acetobacteraceae bacterium]